MYPFDFKATSRDGHVPFVFVVIFTITILFLISFVLEYLFGLITIFSCSKSFLSVVREKTGPHGIRLLKYQNKAA